MVVKVRGSLSPNVAWSSKLPFFLSPRLYPLLFCSFVLSLYAPLTLVVAQAPFFLLSARTSHIYVTSYAMSFFLPTIHAY